MVYATRSSSKAGESGTSDTHPVQTKGKASSSRKSTMPRRTQKGPTVEDQVNESQESHEGESCAVSSEVSSQVDHRWVSASSQPLISTPSRHLRRERASDTESCESSCVAEYQDTTVAQPAPSAGKDDQGLGPINDQSTKPAPTPSRRRRTSSSSSQNTPTTPSRITRSMRKAGITTPKDVVELEIVQEEELAEDQGEQSPEKKGDEPKSPLKSPGLGELSKHLVKDVEYRADEESFAAVELQAAASHTKCAVSSAELAVAVSLRTTVLSCISSSSLSKKSPKESAVETVVNPKSEKDEDVRARGSNSVKSPSEEERYTSSGELPAEDVSLTKVISTSIESSRRCSLTLKELVINKEIASKEVVLDVQNFSGKEADEADVPQAASSTIKSSSEDEQLSCKSPLKQDVVEECETKTESPVFNLPSKLPDTKKSSVGAKTPIYESPSRESTPREDFGIRSAETNPRSPTKTPPFLDQSPKQTLTLEKMETSQEVPFEESSLSMASCDSYSKESRKSRDSDASISHTPVEELGDFSKKLTVQKSTPEIDCDEKKRIQKETEPLLEPSPKETKGKNIDTSTLVTMTEEPATSLQEATKQKSSAEIICIGEEPNEEEPIVLSVKNSKNSLRSPEEEMMLKEADDVLFPLNANAKKNEIVSPLMSPLRKPLTVTNETLTEQSSADIVAVGMEDSEKFFITKKADHKKNESIFSSRRSLTKKPSALSNEGVMEESLPDIVPIEQEDSEKSAVTKKPGYKKSEGVSSPRRSSTNKLPTPSNDGTAEESHADISVIKQEETPKIPIAAAKKEKITAKKLEEELPIKEIATSAILLEASHMTDELEDASVFKPPTKELPSSPVKKSTTKEAVQDAAVVEFDEFSRTSVSSKKKTKKSLRKVEEDTTEKDSVVILEDLSTNKSTTKEVIPVTAFDEGEKIPKEAFPKKKARRSMKKAEENSFAEKESAVEHVSQSEEVPKNDAEVTTPTVYSTELSEEKPRKKKLKKLPKKTGVPEVNNEDEGEEDEVSSSKENDKYVELETFKQLFKRPKFYGKLFKKAICSLYAHSCALNPRRNDLPVELMGTDNETMWQFVSFRCKQISKEYRKNSGLLDVDLSLKKEHSDSEDESESEREDEGEKDHTYIEGEEKTDLFNLNDEDLKDLDRELDELRENENQEEEQDENIAPRKKYPKSIVDDKFFNLAEMNAFLDEQDRMENTTSGILDTADDSWAGTADYCYEDFFGKEDRAGDTENKKKKRAKKRAHGEDSKKSSKKPKTVRFAVEEDADQNEDAFVQDEEEEAQNERVLLGDTEEVQQETSTLKTSLKRLKETIKKLEEENLAPRSWEMSGEVTAQQREENELLETHVEFDLGMKKAPEITEVFTEKLEDLIKQRIIDKVFDDVVRKKRIEERTEVYRNKAIEEREMVKTSLAEVYEKEYQKAAGEAKADDKINEQHAVIEKEMRELFRLIDALSNFDYTPPEVRPEVRVVSNMPALRVEEVGMSASTDAQLLAPEEVKKHQKATPKADDERDRTDKLRQRRKKKNKQRAMVELLGEEKAMEGVKKKKKKVKNMENTEEKGERLKSTTFFTKLQQTVRDEISERTSQKKKKKVKSQEVSSGGSKFML